MSAPNRSRALHVAIYQVYPALPSLLGADFPAFDAKLQPSLTTSVAIYQTIEQMYPVPPSLSDADFPAFFGLQQDRRSIDSQLLDLFESHPPAYNQLLNLLAVLSINPSFLGDILFDSLLGNPQVKNSIIYHCQAGNHDVPLESVQQRTPTGDPICPYDGNPMVVQVQP